MLLMYHRRLAEPHGSVAKFRSAGGPPVAATWQRIRHMFGKVGAGGTFERVTLYSEWRLGGNAFQRVAPLSAGRL